MGDDFCAFLGQRETNPVSWFTIVQYDDGGDDRAHSLAERVRNVDSSSGCFGVDRWLHGRDGWVVYRRYTVARDLALAISQHQSEGRPVYWPDYERMIPSEPTAAPDTMRAIIRMGGELSTKSINPRSKAWIDLLVPNAPYQSTSVLSNALAEQASNFVLAKSAERTAVLEKNRDIFALIDQANRLPPAQLTREFQNEDPVGILLPHVQSARSVSRLIVLHVLEAISTNDSTRAVAAIERGFTFANQLRREPFVISWLVKTAMEMEMLKASDLVLKHRSLTPKELAALDACLAKLQRDDSINTAMEGEFVLLLTVLNRPIDDQVMAQLMNAPPMKGQNGFWDVLGIETEKFWNQIRFSEAGRKSMQLRLLKLAREQRDFSRFDEKSEVEAKEMEKLITSIIGRQSGNSAIHLIARQALRRLRLHVVLTRIALRIEQARQGNKEYPKTLAELKLPDELLHPLEARGTTPIYEIVPGGYTLSFDKSVVAFAGQQPVEIKVDMIRTEQQSNKQ